jgi:uncharacterized RmlC-like cupin family protein
VNERAAPYVLPAGQARSHMGTVPTIKAAAADTGGLFTFCDEMMPARTQGPPLHVHYEADECVYVIDGHLLVQVGEERHDLGPGCFAWLPRQFPHAFAMSPTARCTSSGQSCPAAWRSTSPSSPPTSANFRGHRTPSSSLPSGPVTSATSPGHRSK